MIRLKDQDHTRICPCPHLHSYMYPIDQPRAQAPNHKRACLEIHVPVGRWRGCVGEVIGHRAASPPSSSRSPRARIQSSAPLLLPPGAPSNGCRRGCLSSPSCAPGRRPFKVVAQAQLDVTSDWRGPMARSGPGEAVRRLSAPRAASLTRALVGRGDFDWGRGRKGGGQPEFGQSRPV